MQRANQQQRAKQQLTVLRALSEADGPLSARELWSRLSGSGESVGLATVYRALQRGVEEGTLESVEGLGRGVRYEPKDREHHHHFLCS
ncbi:MAG: transcriptional repressor, partial [Gemmatimonadetes bacterium]|nr:transcriptional repressor [Gemmatimonadota bacterium]